MALSRDKKLEVLNKFEQLLSQSKLVVFAQYTGLNVGDLQDLRSQATEEAVSVKIAKNRLVKIAASKIDRFNNTDLSSLNGQLLYALSDSDEIAPAQILAKFAKQHPELEIKGGLDSDGNLIEAERVKLLAELPSKDNLRAQLVGVLSAPLSGLASVVAGNLRGIVNVLDAHAQELEA